jgi:hypothetical protein
MVATLYSVAACRPMFPHGTRAPTASHSCLHHHNHPCFARDGGEQPFGTRPLIHYAALSSLSSAPQSASSGSPDLL